MQIIIIGGGPGGYVSAIRASQLGAQVTLIEKEHLGGTCLNIGCIPTKCLLTSAELAENIRNRSKELGIEVPEFSVNFRQVIKHKNDISRQLTAGVAGLLKMNKVKVVDGEARFISPGVLSVRSSDGTEQEMKGDAVIIATGSVNARPPIPGLEDTPDVIDSTGALSLEELPESMIVIGAGVIGLEIACAYAAFGTRITVVEAAGSVLPMLDGDISDVGMAHIRKMGVDVHLECPVKSVEPCGDGVAVICGSTDGEVRFTADKALVAVGRRANTESLDLAAGGIENDRGRIVVNERMQTNVPGVYAIGDCVLGYAQLAHTASAMGEVAVENICGLDTVYDETTNPTCVYIEPEAAAVGLTEEQCKAKGLDYIVGKFPMSGNGKALILNGGEGLVKIISEPDYGEILGVHIIGPRATDLISEAAIAIGSELTVDELISTIHSHPTVTEAVREAALDAYGRCIHSAPRRKKK